MEGREEDGAWKDVSLGRRRRSREGDRRRGFSRMKVIGKPVLKWMREPPPKNKRIT